MYLAVGKICEFPCIILCEMLLKAAEEVSPQIMENYAFSIISCDGCIAESSADWKYTQSLHYVPFLGRCLLWVGQGCCLLSIFSHTHSQYLFGSTVYKVLCSLSYSFTDTPQIIYSFADTPWAIHLSISLPIANILPHIYSLRNYISIVGVGGLDSVILEPQYKMEFYFGMSDLLSLTHSVKLYLDFQHWEGETHFKQMQQS